MTLLTAIAATLAAYIIGSLSLFAILIYLLSRQVHPEED